MGGKSKAPVTKVENDGWLNEANRAKYHNQSLGPDGYTTNLSNYMTPERSDYTQQGMDRRYAAAQDPSAAEGYAGDYAGQANSLYNRGADIYQGLSDPTDTTYTAPSEYQRAVFDREQQRNLEMLNQRASQMNRGGSGYDTATAMRELQDSSNRYLANREDANRNFFGQLAGQGLQQGQFGLQAGGQLDAYGRQRNADLMGLGAEQQNYDDRERDALARQQADQRAEQNRINAFKSTQTSTGPEPQSNLTGSILSGLSAGANLLGGNPMGALAGVGGMFGTAPAQSGLTGSQPMMWNSQATAPPTGATLKPWGYM